jgi:hypothetical protein
MGIVARLFGKKAPAGGDPQGLHFYVRCTRCEEVLHVRASRSTDVFQEYPEGSERGVPTLHKEILGSRCPNLMFLHITFDSGYHILSSAGERCEVITREEFDTAKQ